MALASFSLLAATAPAPAAATAEGPRTEVYGGSVAASCAWPSVVMIGLSDATCSGTLIAPNIVLYAAHCGTDVQTILFGEHPVKMVNNQLLLDAPSKQVTPSDCHVYPGHDPLNGTDFAYCKLATPIADIPIVPILSGCEASALHAGKAVTLVGFGKDESGNVGTKKAVTTTLDQVISNKIFVGGNGQDTCQGDSGGPAFVQLQAGDGLSGVGAGEWRVAGITSYSMGTACGSGTFDSLADVAAPWIEASSGVDVTPCTTAEGIWQPTAACGGSPTTPAGNGSSWPKDCAGGAVLGLSATCGAPYGAGNPTVSFTSPHSGLVPGNPAQVTVALTAADAIGAPVRTLTLTLDGQALTANSGTTAPQYSFGPVTLGAGTHALVATAVDGNGNVTTASLSVSAALSAGGCSATSAPAGWAAALVAWRLWRAARRRRRAGHGVPRALALGAALGLVACGGGPGLSLQAGGAQLAYVHAGAAAVGNDATATVPAATATLSGLPAAAQFTPVGATYLFQDSGSATSMVVVLSNRADACSLILGRKDVATQRSLRLQLFAYGLAEDEPLDGTFTVIVPGQNVPGAGHYAYATLLVNDSTCGNTLSDANAMPTAGTITVATHVSNAGVWVTGSFSGLTLAGAAAPLSGTFTAAGCNTTEVDASVQATCAAK